MPLIVLVLACVLAAEPALAERFAVGVVPSDDPALAAPAPRDQELNADQVLDMVRKAVDLAGGMAAVVPDTARLVAIKPNIVMAAPPGSGVVTDARVVRAVAILVHAVAPRARILIAEGAGGWISPAFKDSAANAPRSLLVDGFEVSGHRATVAELRGQGVDIDCYDLNFDRVAKLQVPGGGLARDEYEVAATIVEADAWINCPVAKTHGAKITCCMKNHFGILPGKVYGWDKGSGTEQHRGIPHSPQVVDESWVDLWALTRVDLNVVDMIAGTQGGAFGGKAKRCNIVLAGRDPVATDLVAAKLMGFNPDDFEFADLAWQRGMGPGLYERIEVRGAQPDSLVSRFAKAGMDYTGGERAEWGEHANYGTGPRRWTLLGPLPRDHQFSEQELTALAPDAGRDGWSPVVWFGHDRINLGKLLKDPADCAMYAFTRFVMPQADSVRFWAGSDEGLKVWIDGQLVHAYEGTRKHHLGQDRVRAFLGPGEHRLLVRAEQTYGRFEFSFNVCEPIDDEFFAGNRYPGVRYYVTSGPALPAAPVQVRGEAVMEGVFTVETENTLGSGGLIADARSIPDTALVQGVPAPVSDMLIPLLVQSAGLQRADLDSVDMACMGAAPFGLAYLGYGKEGWDPGYGPGLGRLAGWLGLRYAASYGAGAHQTCKMVKAWLAAGQVPVLGWRERWGQVTGYRDGSDQIELYLITPDTAQWISGDVALDQWWACLPGGMWKNCALVVADKGEPGLSVQALTDSMAVLAVDMGLRPSVEFEPEPWGTRRAPAGLAAWDAWVAAWEQQPLTPEWAAEERTRDHLRDLGGWFLPNLAKGRRLAAAYFEQAADRAPAQPAKARLRQAACGYRQVTATLDTLIDMMPRGEDGEQAAPDSARLQRIGQARPLVRQARAAEREALGALAAYLGRPDLPPVVEDPMRRKESGRKLLTWRAEYSKGVYDLSLREGRLEQRRLTGKEMEGVAYELYEPLPKAEGWQVVVEVAKGDGIYRVVQQPSAANGWTLVLRADDEWTRRGNQIELVAWAVPVIQ